MKDVWGLFPCFGGARYGGAQVSGRLAWEAIQAEVKRRGGRARLFCYEGSPTAAVDEGRRDGKESVRATSRIAAVWQALKFGAGARPSLVMVWHLGLLKLLPFFRPGSAPVILTLLGIEAWREHDPLMRRLLRRVDYFLSISDYTWERFAARNPQLAGKPHKTVYLGIGAPAGQLPALPNAPSAIMISRLDAGEDYKGHREVITVWGAVRERMPDARLMIVGDGTLRLGLEALARSCGVEGSVRFCGTVDEATKHRLIGEARCLLMPSRGEGFGLAYLEAMRLGRPCLVSPFDAGREVVNPPEAGLMADPDDRTELVEAICRLMGEGADGGGEWEGWSMAARGRYERHFTAAQFQARLTAAIDSFICESSM